ncbi:MAG: hypothetical protein D6717_02020, partial [Gammaproteobacteria bacterium]
HRVPGLHMAGRVTATIVSLADFIGQDFEQVRIVIDRATQGLLAPFCRHRIALVYGLSHIHNT